MVSISRHACHPEDGGRVEQHDAAHRRVQRGIEECQASEPEVRPGVVALHGGGGDVLGELDLDRFDHGTEQALLGREMVSERASRHPGALDDVLLARPGETPLGEQLAARVEQRPACGRSPFAPGSRRPASFGGIPVDTHPVPQYKCV